jgi:hypothetical protein
MDWLGMSLNSRNQLWLAFIITLFVISITVIIISINYMYQHGPVKCIPIQLIRRQCAIHNLEEIYRIDNSLAIFDCGSVSNCITSPYNNKLTIGQTYWCTTLITSTHFAAVKSQSYFDVITYGYFIVCYL